jgi:pyrroline-5-carboxylate reductase
MLGLIGYGRLGQKIVRNVNSDLSVMVGINQNSSTTSQKKTLLCHKESFTQNKNKQSGVCEPREMDEKAKITYTSDLFKLGCSCSDIIFSLKRSSLNDLKVINSYRGNIISAMAGVNRSELCLRFPQAKVIQIMPNIYMDNITYLNNDENDYHVIKKIFPRSRLISVSTSKQLEVTTIVHGCSPALFSWLFQELYEYGRQTNDPVYTKQMILDVMESTFRELHYEDPQNIIDTVTSPNGITEKLIKKLKHSEFLK